MGKRAGRKLKSGPREPNGQRQRPTAERLNAMAARARLEQQRTVLEQPHRRGEASPLASSALGRLCLREKLRPELYRAGEGYASIVACWRSAKGVPVTINRTPGPTTEGPDDATVRRWKTKMLALERAMLREGSEVLFAVRTLVLDEADVGIAHDHYAVRGLFALAVELDLCRSNEAPFLENAA